MFACVTARGGLVSTVVLPVIGVEEDISEKMDLILSVYLILTVCTYWELWTSDPSDNVGQWIGYRMTPYGDSTAPSGIQTHYPVFLIMQGSRFRARSLVFPISVYTKRAILAPMLPISNRLFGYFTWRFGKGYSERLFGKQNHVVLLHVNVDRPSYVTAESIVLKCRSVKFDIYTEKLIRHTFPGTEHNSSKTEPHRR
jgi:hypothetical protein